MDLSTHLKQRGRKTRIRRSSTKFPTRCNTLEPLPTSIVTFFYRCSLSLLPGAYFGVLVEELTALCAPRQYLFGKSRLSEWQCVSAGTQCRHCPINFNIAHMQNVCVCL